MVLGLYVGVVWAGPQIVKEPMDLKTMGEKVKNGQYRSLQEMRDDCELMSKNALLFNRAPGEVSTITRGIKSCSRRCKWYFSINVRVESGDQLIDTVWGHGFRIRFIVSISCAPWLRR